MLIAPTKLQTCRPAQGISTPPLLPQAQNSAAQPARPASCVTHPPAPRPSARAPGGDGVGARYGRAGDRQGAGARGAARERERGEGWGGGEGGATHRGGGHPPGAVTARGARRQPTEVFHHTHPSFRALFGRNKFTVPRHEFDKTFSLQRNPLEDARSAVAERRLRLCQPRNGSISRP